MTITADAIVTRDSITRARDLLEAAEAELAAAEDRGMPADIIAELSAEVDAAEQAYYRAVDTWTPVLASRMTAQLGV